MKDETIDILKMGASMAMLAVLIVYVVQSVILGKQIQSKTSAELNSAQIISESGGLKDLNDVETIIPAASLLALLQYNHRNIGTVTCYICDQYGEERTMNESLCITTHLKGNVRVYIKYDSGMGLFNITIKPV